MRSGGSSGGGSACSEDNEGCDSHTQKKSYHRHTPDQIQRLEGFYKQCAHPDEKQRRQLGIELGLEPRQIKFWFQNKRTQTKAQNERSDNNTLRAENDRIRSENIAIKEALKNVTCGSCGPCGGGPVTDEEKNQICEKLKQENIELQKEYNRVSSILAKFMGRPLSRPELNVRDVATSNEAIRNLNSKNLGLTDQMKANPELEKLLMAEIAASAMDELIKLLKVDQPLWIKSQTEEQYVLDYDCYYKIVSGTKESRYLNSRMESSKDAGVVAMDARLLVDLYLDPDKWVDLFPTVFSKARSISILKAGLLENRSDSLQLIHEQMHVLSPLMRQREFYVLRYCQQIETGTWVIMDVSYDFYGASRVFPTFCWKYPSGCMIEEMPNGLSRVTCVERVEIDDSILVHPIYEVFVKSTLAFGAKRWIATLQRTCERYSFLKEAGRLDDQLGIGRRGMIMLASKMIKSYCSTFKLFGKLDFHQRSELTNNKVQITVYKSTSPDQPAGIVILAASSFWVPTSPKRVFSFLNDHSTRAQWDILCNGGQVSEVLQIPTGHYPSNLISILQPQNPFEDLMIFQESAVDQLGSFIVYAPVETSSMLEVATGIGSPHVPILASGFSIIPDGSDWKAAPSTSSMRPRSGGSVITAAFQILGCSSLSSEDLSLTLISRTEAFVSRVVCVLKSAFNSPS
ncbi:hypothetical protein RND81_09G211700 [Saponaria officinalis]|uniref:Uncharacterized protein n=1 Tax=Saponaria officinalis TaxID=3572 RepID=A0AAW1IQH5_SAPOF